ncbi:CPBP family intramembrane metalloprotease [Williamsia sp. CHRR-6]|nr:CPBP family intramembrane metalloprotease [Williamsia sp. CHRR-6]
MQLVAVPVGALALLAYARLRGMRWHELGLRELRRGARWGGVVAGVTVAAVAAVALIPALQPAFLNERYGVNVGATLLAVLVIIPLQTVIPEEILFRGVLHGTLSRRFGLKSAAVIGSILFGLWHIASSLSLTAGNKGFSGAVGSGSVGQILGVLGAVAATTVAGFAFIWLRHRSRSILAPIGLHWALNGAGALAALAVWHVTSH